MINLIGLAGEARAGKSSAAVTLCRELGLDPYALSSPIKAMINALFGWDESHAEGSLKETVVEVGLNRRPLMDQWAKYRMEELVGFNIAQQDKFEALIELLFQDETAAEGPYISPRRAYQLFGTEYGRGLRPTIWLDIARQALEDAEQGLVITDIRFPNEHKWVSYNGGFVVHVRRKGSGHIIGGPVHESEAGLKKMAMDWQTPECADLEELETNMKRVAQFAAFSQTSDVRLSGRMPSFETVYGDALNG